MIRVIELKHPFLTTLSDRRRATLFFLLLCCATGWLTPFAEPPAWRLAAGFGVGAVLLAWFYLNHTEEAEQRALETWIARRSPRTEDATRSPQAAAARWAIVTAIVLAFYGMFPHPFAQILWTLVFCGKKGPTTRRGESKWTQVALVLLPAACLTVLALTVQHAFAPGAKPPGQATWWAYAAGAAGVLAAFAVDALTRRWFPVAQAIPAAPAAPRAPLPIPARKKAPKHRRVSGKPLRSR